MGKGKPKPTLVHFVLDLVVRRTCSFGFARPKGEIATVDLARGFAKSGSKAGSIDQ